jgi:hypothetical protein
LLYFSSCFYLKFVTVSKWLCFISHKLFTYSYLFIFSSVSTGCHSDPVNHGTRPRRGRGHNQLTPRRGPRLSFSFSSFSFN